MLVSKIDLLPYLDINIDKLIDNIKSVNPDIDVITLSAKTEEGIEEWLKFLENQRKNLINN